MIAFDPYSSLRGWLYSRPWRDDPIATWVRYQAFMRRFKTADSARREVCYASEIIAWKLAGEHGPAPEREAQFIHGRVSLSLSLRRRRYGCVVGDQGFHGPPERVT